MVFDIEVNNRSIRAEKGETILSALERNGIQVPTLCSMSGFSPTGACRICVVEVEGKPNLIPACSHPVEEWMKIKTHSPRVVKARRTIVELLLANHPDDCLYCVRNGNCELQKLAEELDVRERPFATKEKKVNKDLSSVSIARDPSKCILCGRCVRVCEETQACSSIDFAGRGNRTFISTTFNKPLNMSSCVDCGQCIRVCPTGALYTKHHLLKLQEALHDKEKTVVVQYAPSISISIADEFGIKPGKDINGVLNTVLRKIGFNYVFDTSFAGDVAIMEGVAELQERIEKNENLPLITSCCPSWVKFAEEFKPNFLPNLSTTKSPQQIMGTIIKSYWAEKENINSENVYSVAIMPCTSKKFESQREEMTHKGISGIDAVLTTREFIKLIRLHGIDINTVEPEMPDLPMGMRSSAGKIYGVAGGEMEATLRTLYFKMKGKEMPDLKIADLRTTKDLRETKIKIGKQDIGVAVVSGLANAKKLLEDIEAGKKDIHFIEIMACPDGCINGGGQSINTDDKALKARKKALYTIDDQETIRVAHKNSAVLELYDKFLGEPYNDKCKKLLHTHFTKRDEVFL